METYAHHFLGAVFVGPVSSFWDVITCTAVYPPPIQPSVTRIAEAKVCVLEGELLAGQDHVTASVTINTLRRETPHHSTSDQDTSVTMDNVSMPDTCVGDIHRVMIKQTCVPAIPI